MECRNDRTRSDTGNERSLSASQSRNLDFPKKNLVALEEFKRLAVLNQPCTEISLILLRYEPIAGNEILKGVQSTA
jgi:hypothetical protein